MNAFKFDEPDDAPRMKSIIPPKGKVGTKYKNLLEEMKKLTGYNPKQGIPPQPQWGAPSNPGTLFVGGGLSGGGGILGGAGFNGYFQGGGGGGAGSPPEPLMTVLFYGFNGMLARKYSVIGNMSHEDIQARMQFAGDKVPYSIKDYSQFNVVIQQMENTADRLTQIPFEDAMNIIRIGIENSVVEEFVDAEKDEFDDNCVETCKPGQHACGK